MSIHRQPRRIARELALLSLSQLSRKESQEAQLDSMEIENLLLAATRTLGTEVKEALETASSELSRSNERLLNSETRAANLNSAKSILQEAIALTQQAINRLGDTLEIPETIQFVNQTEVRQFSIDLIRTVHRHLNTIDQTLQDAMVDWQLSRLAKIDQDILRLALAEICYLDVPAKVAINEAIELAKRYSEKNGHRFINGVLRRVTNQLASSSNPPTNRNDKTNVEESNK